MSRLKKELSLSTEERETLQLDKELLGSRLKNMEAEMESQRGSQTDRSREVRSLEVSRFRFYAFRGRAEEVPVTPCTSWCSLNFLCVRIR